MARQTFTWLNTANRNGTQTSPARDIPAQVLEIGLVIDMTNMTSPNAGLRVAIQRSDDDITWEDAAAGEMPGGQKNRDGTARTQGEIAVSGSPITSSARLRGVITTGTFTYVNGAGVFSPGGSVRYGASIFVVT